MNPTMPDPSPVVGPIPDSADLYVLQGSSSSNVQKIALKQGDAFMVTDVRGDLPETEQDTGLFWHGTCFLRTCDLFLAGVPLTPLSYTVADAGNLCQIDLCNPFFTINAETILPQGTIHVRRLIEVRDGRMLETISITSYHDQPVLLPLGLRLDADYQDVFEVRGMHRTLRGELFDPEMGRDALTLRYMGRDHVLRETHVALEPAADRVVNHAVFWSLPLQHAIPVELQIAVDLREIGDQPRPPFEVVDEAPQETRAFAVLPEIATDNIFFNRLITSGMNDLMMMTTMTPQGLVPYAGLPWYVCPFGRDALITSLEFLPWFPEITRGTLTFLAAYQGTKVDPFTEEEPGRILHEFRRGEMANCREIPFIPYYGTVDATPLFLMLLGDYTRWTNDLALLQRMWPHAEAAARWMIEYGDLDGDTLLEYHKISDKGLVSQGWKDSFDAISHADGTLAHSPIALAEVQGYAYAAYRAMSYMAGRLGKHDAANTWDATADTLQANFLAKFWWPEEDCVYLALDGDKRPCKVVSSNAGQCLWTGILPDDLAHATVRRLMRPDMNGQWGIRTLSSGAARYNPMSYHNGSVWPHDNALIGAGFARYGRKLDTSKLLADMYAASLYYENARLPELFCGFPRREGFGPTRYPVACAPQSWASGAPFLLLSAVLGFQPDAENHRLTLHYPLLPDWLQNVELRGLRLGNRRGHLCFVRAREGTAVTLMEDSEFEIQVLAR